MYTVTTENNALKNIDMSTPWGNVSFKDGVATDVTEEQKILFTDNPHYEITKAVSKTKKAESVPAPNPKAKGNGNGKKNKKVELAEDAPSETSASSEPDDLDLE